MKMEKLNLFKVVNVFMVVFCACTMWMNGIGVRVVNSDTAVSSMNGTNFEYETLNDSIVFKKDGKWTGSLPTNKKLSIRNDNVFFNVNAGVVVAKAAAAAAAGANFGAAVVDGIVNIVGPGALAAAADSMVIPGTAAVEATMAGAGEAAAAAAAADAALMAGGTAAVISSVVIPMLAIAGATTVVL